MRAHALNLALAFVVVLAVGVGLRRWTQADAQPAASAVVPSASTPVVAGDRAEMILVRGGRFRMGTDRPDQPAAPPHDVVVADFWLDACEVTCRQFAEFVAATKHVTTAEREASGDVFDGVSHSWRGMAGADWRHPGGLHTSIDRDADVPVVQVSWHDARAYATWTGKRLPSEAEWEYAARAGQHAAEFPWGADQRAGGRYHANYWQGWFPERDLGSDGFRALAPVASFEPNPWGLYDMAGNAAEWCADWYAPDAYGASRLKNPTGPQTGSERVLRGGSWLSAQNSPAGIRVWQRDSADPTARRCDIGFRCARDADGK